MKKLFLIAIASLTVFNLAAQETNKKSGKVVYEKVKKLNIKLDGEASSFANMLPKERKSNMVMLFNEKASIYQNEKQNQEVETKEETSGNTTVNIKIVEPDNKFHYDIINKKSVSQQEFMTRKFLIEGEPETSGWKITGNQKKILGYNCTEAIKTVDTNKTHIWFAPSLPIATGPEIYAGVFPGMVLEVNYNNGDDVIIAKSIKFEPIDEKVLIKPKSGKKVTREEYNKIVDEKKKEMNAQGGGNNIIIRTIRE